MNRLDLSPPEFCRIPWESRESRENYLTLYEK